MYLLSVADAGHAMSTVASALALLAVFVAVDVIGT